MCIPLTAEKGKILENVSMMAFLDMDMKHKIIHSINLPELDENYHLTTYKVINLEIYIVLHLHLLVHTRTAHSAQSNYLEVVLGGVMASVLAIGCKDCGFTSGQGQ
jgi:hypothetical protein